MLTTLFFIHSPHDRSALLKILHKFENLKHNVLLFASITSSLSPFSPFLPPSLPSPPSSLSLYSDTFQVNEHNLAYLTALFPESDIVRQQLQDNRTRLMTYIPSRSASEGQVNTQKPFSYTPLLNTHIIATHKSQILFLHLLVRGREWDFVISYFSPVYIILLSFFFLYHLLT